MKKLLYSIIFSLGFLPLRSMQQPLSAQTLDNLNVVTFLPNVSNQGLDKSCTDSFESIVAALKGKKRSNLHGVNVQIPNNDLIVSCGLPEHYTGTIYLNVPPLICSADKHAYPERGASEIYSLFKAGVIEQGIGVSYCPQSHKRKLFNFGQEDDQKTISTLLNTIAKKNPQAKIVPMGICAGATGILNTLAGSELTCLARKNIDSAILQSPAISSDKVWQDMGNSYLPRGLRSLFPLIAPLYFTNCKSSNVEEKVLDSYKNIPRHICFMVGKLTQDPVTPAVSVGKVEEALKTSKHKVAVFESGDSSLKHGFMAPNKEYQSQIKQFLIQRKLDHAATAGLMKGKL